jgi:hypothetical protein
MSITIGSGTNRAALNVHNTVAYTSTISNARYFNFDNNYVNADTTISELGVYSIYASSNIVTKASFISTNDSTFSDKRIKKNIQDLDGDESLNILRKITPCKYNLIDVQQQGNNLNYGFIAQDIEPIVPDCINITKGEVPNIYSVGNVTNGNIITLENSDVNMLQLDMSNPEILVYDILDVEKYIKIKRIIDNKTFEIEDTIKDTKVFVFGQKVNDLKTITYNYIYTILTSCVKRIDETVQSQQGQIDSLLKTVESQQGQIDSLLKTVESQQKQIDSLLK